MTILQILAAVTPIVLLATLAARAAVWKTKLSARVDTLEARIDKHQTDLHEIGTALRRNTN